MRKEKAPHLNLGQTGESIAANFFLAHGYAILARNWRHGHLEIDIICERDSQIVFVEVKTRRNSLCGGPAGALTQAKRQKLCKAAQFWLFEYKRWEAQCRFDVICLTAKGPDFIMEHYPDAFPATCPLDCGDAAWQS